MVVHEYGEAGRPLLVLLAPMMVSGKDLYQLMVPCFKGDYHVVAPDQGGHGDAGGYISAEDEYRQLKAWLQERGLTNVALAYGASLGAAVAYRLFLDPAFTVAHAWFDGTALCESAAFAEWFTKRLFKSRKKMLARHKTDVSTSLVRMYGLDFARMMTKNFERITDADIDAICRACCHYELRPLTEEEQEKLHLDFGEKDFDLRYARKAISAYMPNAELAIRPRCPHCGYMAAHPKEYVAEIERFIGNVGSIN